MKVVIISCYSQVETHARPRVLRQALAECEGVEAIIVKNRRRGVLRYLEVPCRLLWVVLRQRPDAYIVTFRGYEILPFTLLVAGRKPVIFDELVNAVEYLHEHGKLRAGTLADRLARTLYGLLIRRCRYVLADTDAHAELSAELSRMPRERFITMPVGTEEDIFYPAAPTPHEGFNVFFYGVMVKLHGLDYFLDAAIELSRRYPDITFTVGGDTGKADNRYAEAKKQGARLTHRTWFPFEQLLDYARSADLCVGGPFGDTPQSQYVITTKTFQFLAAACPVIIGRNQVNGMFVDRKNSLVVPQGDTRALVESIAWAHDHPKQMRAIGREGRKLYEEQFSHALVVSRVQQLVEACR